MASNNDKAAKAGVARLRERYHEIKRNIKISPKLEDALTKRKPVEKKDEANKSEKKIARPPREDLDL
jgi:hypothetical protein